MDGAAEKKGHVRRRGLKRRVVGWGLVALGVAVMGLSVWSRGRDCTVFAEGRGYGVSAGVTSGVVQVQVIKGQWTDVLVYSSEPTSEEPWRWWSSFHRVQAEYRWWGWRWFRSVQTFGVNTFAAVPLWMFAVVAGGCGGLLVRSGARARLRGMERRCGACGYDLAGLGVGARCPECGEGEPGGAGGGKQGNA